MVRKSLAIPIAMRRHVIERKKRQVGRMLDELNSRVEHGELLMDIPNLGLDFYVDMRSHNARRLLLHKSYEPHVIDRLRENVAPDRDVIDIGANVGFISLFAASLLNHGQHVLAVEPTPRALELLRRNVGRHHLDRKIIITEGVATAEAQDAIPIHVVEGKEEYSSVNGIYHPAVRTEASSTVEVKGYRIDDLVAHNGLNPGFIKIDTEGHEDSVLEGAYNTLRDHSPVVLTELSDRLLASTGGARAIVRKLEALGYQVRDAEHPEQEPRFPFEGEVIAFKN